MGQRVDRPQRPEGTRVITVVFAGSLVLAFLVGVWVASGPPATGGVVELEQLGDTAPASTRQLYRTLGATSTRRPPPRRERVRP